MANEDKKEAEGGNSAGRLTKIFAAVGGSVMVPVLVAVLSKWLDPAFLMSKHSPTTATSASTEPRKEETATALVAKSIPPTTSPAPGPMHPNRKGVAKGTHAPPSPPLVKKTSGELVSPKLGENFYSYGWSTAAKDFARNNNVDPNLFRFVEQLPDGSRHPSIHVLPDEKMGFLSTKEEFDNYTLHVWWRWGEKPTAKANFGRRAAIMLHIQGPDGGVAGALPQSIVVQLREGHAGSLWVIAPENVVKYRARIRKIPGQLAPIYDPNANEQPLASMGTEQRPNHWAGVIFPRDYDPKIAEARAKEVSHKPGTVWNKLRIDSEKGKITVYLNNKVINEISGCTQSRGRIGFTTNRSEWYIGKVELIPKIAQAIASEQPGDSPPPSVASEPTISPQPSVEAKPSALFGKGKGNEKIDLATKEPAPTPFSTVVRAHFKNWDLDSDAKLTSTEIHAAMTRPRIKGDVAAAVATLRCYERYAYTSNDREMPPFTLTDLSQYEAADQKTRIEKFGARGEDFDSYFKEFKRRLKETPRQLFPQNGVPQLSAVKQGYLGDCFFISMVGAFVHMHPNKVRNMIKEVEGNKYTVTFAGWPAPVTVLAPTDAEIALNSTAEKNGLWLTVLEKAFAKRENFKAPKNQREKSMTDAIAEGGYATDALVALTGHSYIEVIPRNPNFPDILKAAVDAHCLIITTVRPKRDVPELYTGHLYAVIGYDGHTKQVKIFDPLGADFTPKTKSGPRSGYPMKDGVFTMPLEEFKQVFTGITYEDMKTPAIDKKKTAKN